jgi:hypothetical protein
VLAHRAGVRPASVGRTAYAEKPLIAEAAPSGKEIANNGLVTSVKKESSQVLAEVIAYRVAVNWLTGT